MAFYHSLLMVFASQENIFHRRKAFPKNDLVILSRDEFIPPRGFEIYSRDTIALLKLSHVVVQSILTKIHVNSIYPNLFSFLSYNS